LFGENADNFLQMCLQNVYKDVFNQRKGWSFEASAEPSSELRCTFENMNVITNHTLLSQF